MAHRIEHNREVDGGRGHGPAAAFEGYDEARTSAAVYERGARGVIQLTGRDGSSFLHGILTNDIAALEPGHACYAAYLTPQGRMLSDMMVLRRDRDVLLEVEPDVRERTVQRLDQSIFAEDVRVVDRSDELVSIAIYGPRAAEALDSALSAVTGDRPALPQAQRHLTLATADGELVVLGVKLGDLDGFHVFAPASTVERPLRALGDAGAPRLAAPAYESLRIEAGVPRFGDDMTDDTIPLEAGIQDRAISMTKGCYVGQEVIVRILHRGQGRVARRLVRLAVEGEQVPERGASLSAGDRTVGHVTSAAQSPRFGAIALGYVHRDFTEPGTRLRSGDVEVTVSGWSLS